MVNLFPFSKTVRTPEPPPRAPNQLPTDVTLQLTRVTETRGPYDTHWDYRFDIADGRWRCRILGEVKFGFTLELEQLEQLRLEPGRRYRMILEELDG